MDTKTRITELEQIIEQKKASMSKTSFRSWYSQSSEVHELCNLKSQVMNTKARQPRQPRDWRNDPATSRQIQYLNKLGIELEPAMTKGRASDLIDAARGDYVGSIGGRYRDGSN